MPRPNPDRRRDRRPLGRKCRRGFTLAEAVMSVVLVGLLMVAALRSVGATKVREVQTVDQLRGQQLSSDLLSEILMQAYQESVDVAIFGPEANEISGNRSLFDDVDDYLGWTSTPPSGKSGMALPGFSGWTQSVNVVWADPVTLGATASSTTGLKKITVTVSKGGKTIDSRVGYRSIAWVDTIPSPTDATSNHPPVAVATSPDLTQRVGQAVTFSATTSSDQDGDYLSYVWDFGDGTKGTGTAPTHIYYAAQSFTCKLTVYDGNGGVSTSALVAVISP